MKIDRKKLDSIKMIFFDFDGVFTDNTVFLSEEGIETVVCSREDGMGISLLKELNIKTYIVSTEENPVVEARARKLNIPCKQNVNDKAEVIRDICKQDNIDISDTIFVGNDINDIPALKIAGIAIVVKDSHEDVIQYSDYITKNKGGKGAVREICDLLYHSRI